MMTNPTTRFLLRFAAPLGLTLMLACGSEPQQLARTEDHGEEQGHDEHEEHEGGAALVPEELEHAGVAFVTVGPGYVDDGVELLGAVRPNGDRLAHITPRFAGIVREVRKNVGDRVRAGEVLAVLESSESLAPYQLTTLIDGIIIEKHLTRGEAVDRETPCFVIADLSTVWVDLAVYQKDMARVRLGQSVRVRAADGGPEGEGSISYLTPALDEATRTATARVELPNLEGQWRPGMFVTARALAEHEARLVVPTGALQTLKGRDVVFVADEHGVEPRPVTLGHRGETVVEVLSGLEPGARVASANTFLLKAELGKGEAEHEH